MSTRANTIQHADFVSVNLDIEASDLMVIGEKMQAINREAFMNGANWEAFIDCYLTINHPELRDGLQGDAEPGSYVGLYPNDALGNKKADRLAALLNRMIDNPEVIYSFLRDEGDGVEWS